MEKFILLDIDGVMVPGIGSQKVLNDLDGFYTFNLRAQRELDRLLELTGATIVLTTTHRSRYNKSRWTEILKKRLDHVGNVDLLDEYITTVYSTSNRLKEIIKWGDGFGKGKTYVILDDDKFLYDLPLDIKKHWVPIQTSTGLNNENVNEALRILNVVVGL